MLVGTLVLIEGEAFGELVSTGCSAMGDAESGAAVTIGG